MRKLALVLAAAAMSACSADSLVVSTPANSEFRVRSANLDYQDPADYVSPEIARLLQESMQERFFDRRSSAFVRGSDMNVRYRFVGAEAGGGLVVEAEFLAPGGEVQGRVRSSLIPTDASGGVENRRIRAAADEIADYAEATFFLAARRRQ